MKQNKIYTNTCLKPILFKSQSNAVYTSITYFSFSTFLLLSLLCQLDELLCQNCYVIVMPDFRPNPELVGQKGAVSAYRHCSGLQSELGFNIFYQFFFIFPEGCGISR